MPSKTDELPKYALHRRYLTVRLISPKILDSNIFVCQLVKTKTFSKIQDIIKRVGGSLLCLMTITNFWLIGGKTPLQRRMSGYTLTKK